MPFLSQLEPGRGAERFSAPDDRSQRRCIRRGSIKTVVTDHGPLYDRGQRPSLEHPTANGAVIHPEQFNLNLVPGHHIRISGRLHLCEVAAEKLVFDQEPDIMEQARRIRLAPFDGSVTTTQPGKPLRDQPNRCRMFPVAGVIEPPAFCPNARTIPTVRHKARTLAMPSCPIAVRTVVIGSPRENAAELATRSTRAVRAGSRSMIDPMSRSPDISLARAR